jgi:predicted outer membrane repeat protein
LNLLNNFHYNKLRFGGILIYNNNFSVKSIFNKILVLFLFLGLSMIFLFTVQNVSAVNNNTIYVNSSSGDDSSDGATWLTAKKSIKNATGTVNKGGNIFISNGLYIGENNSMINIDKDMIIKGQNKYKTVINGSKNYIFGVNNGINLALLNLTLTAGKIDFPGSVLLNSGTLIINNSIVTGVDGREQSPITNNGQLRVYNSTFSHNLGSEGGVIYSPGSAIFNRCNFYYNQAGWGGVEEVGGSSQFNGCMFSSNSANFGGAIAGYYGDIQLNNCTFINNSASKGGAIYSESSVAIKYCSFIQNRASMGGAIYIFEGYGYAKYSSFIKNSSPFCTDIYWNDPINVTPIPNPFNAQYNWWGSNHPNFNHRVSGTITSPWLYMTLNAVPNAIKPGHTTKLIVSFNQVFNGKSKTSINPKLGHIPNGTIVTIQTNSLATGHKSTTLRTFNGVTILYITSKFSGTITAAAYSNDQVLKTKILVSKYASTTTKTTVSSVSQKQETVSSTNTVQNMDNQNTGVHVTDTPVTPFSAGLSTASGLKQQHENSLH